jgi:NADH-quinone oxidoreductase subunit M
MKFFIFSQAAGLLMLLGILGLFFINSASTGRYTFNYFALANTARDIPISVLFMLGFFVSFAVKMPVFGFHSWQPDAYTYSSTGPTILLSALLSKTGAYGLIRFVLPLFPAPAFWVSEIIMAIAVIGILFGAIVAFAQSDLKRFLAYSSLSHMSFILLGIFSLNQLALQGAIILVFAHALSIAALFTIAGYIELKIGSRDLYSVSGLWSQAPSLGGFTMFFMLASMGLPASQILSVNSWSLPVHFRPAL